MKKYWNKKAFTLAEVLVTLTVVALAAVITLPVFRGGVDQKVTDGQKKTFKAKLKENLHAMQLAGDLAEGYDTTEDFIKAMQKHMHIAQTCKPEKLSDCFPSKVITEDKQVKYNVQNIRKASDLHKIYTEDSDVWGVVFADGTSAILAYDSDCYVKDKYDSSADLQKCFVMVYDTNGKNAPNIYGVDVFDKDNTGRMDE